MATTPKEFKTVRIPAKQHAKIKQHAARFCITMDEAIAVVIQRGLTPKSK